MLLILLLIITFSQKYKQNPGLLVYRLVAKSLYFGIELMVIEFFPKKIISKCIYHKEYIYYQIIT